MQVGTLAVQHLFERDIHYSVPLYQRPYVWNEDDQWRPLWEDLRPLAETIAQGKLARAHFMGASVQDRQTVPPGTIETRLLIDGQQRMTTLQLLLKAFHDIVAARGNEPYALAIDKLVSNNHPLSTEVFQKFKIWPTNADRDDFRAVMTASGRVDLLKELGVSAAKRRVNRSIPDAYLYFTEEIESWLAEDPEKADARIAALYSAIRDNVRLVVIDLDEKDDAQMIFETLNARGTPLLSADLVKNSLLNEVQAEGGDVGLAYETYWQKFDSDAAFWRALVGRGHAQRARIETFLQHTLTLLSGSVVSAGHLYSAYRDFAKSPTGGSAIDRLDKFRVYGAIFKRLQGEHHEPRINAFFDRLRTLDVVTAWPFLLALFERFEHETKVLEAVLTALESFLVRRVVCRLSTRSYNEMFAGLTAELLKDAANAPAAVRSYLLSGTAETDRWPRDEEFRSAWISNPLYENLTRPRMRLLLEALEEETRSKFAEETAVPKGLTIEHVMPRGWREHWALPPGLAAEMRDRAVHRIGNLTLVNGRMNTHQSNRPWIDGGVPEGGKRSELAAHTVLFLNKALCQYGEWDEERIAARADELFDVAVKIWPRPETERWP